MELGVSSVGVTTVGGIVGSGGGGRGSAGAQEGADVGFCWLGGVIGIVVIGVVCGVEGCGGGEDVREVGGVDVRG